MQRRLSVVLGYAKPCLGLLELTERWHYETVTNSDLSDTFRKSRVASTNGWLALGLTRAQFRSLVRSGDLVRICRGVYATKTAAASAQTSPAREHALLAIAVRIACGSDSVVSHQSAALIHGLNLFPAAAPGLVTLTRPPARRCSRPKSDGIAFHTAELPHGHVTEHLGAQLTSVPRTVVDLARVSSFMSGVVTADSALREGLTTREAFITICEACAGWPGIRRARRVVEFADPGAESVLESCARVVFHEHGLEPPELQFSVTGPAFRYSVDFYWPRHRLIAEADGAIKYSDQRAAIRQLNRDQQLRDLGYQVVHFTWRELFQSTDEVIARIRKGLTALTPVKR